MGQSSTILSDTKNLLLGGQWDQAIGQLESLKNEDSSAEVFENLARAFALRGRYLSVLSIYLEWARCELERGDLERAEVALGYAEALSPGALEVRGVGLEIARARADSKLLVERLQGMAILALDLGESDSSPLYLREAIEVAPGDLDLRLQLAELLVTLGQIPAALKEYRGALDRFREAGLLEESLRPLRGLKLLSSDDPAVLLEYGETFLELDRLDEAEEQFRAVLRLDLENLTALLRLGQVCFCKGLFRNGILALSKALQLDPDCAGAHRLLGDTLAASADLKSALEKYHRAAQLYIEIGQPQKAAEVFRSMLKHDPHNSEALSGLMVLGFEAGVPGKDEDVSITQLGAIAVDPDFPESSPRDAPAEEAKGPSGRKLSTRPALVKKSEFAEPSSTWEREPRVIRPGLMLRSDSENDCGGSKKLFLKPVFAPKCGDVSEPEREWPGSDEGSSVMATESETKEVLQAEAGGQAPDEEDQALKWVLVQDVFSFEGPQESATPQHEQANHAGSPSPESSEFIDIFEGWEFLESELEFEPAEPKIFESTEEVEREPAPEPCAEQPLPFEIPLPSAEYIDARETDKFEETGENLLALLNLTLPPQPAVVRSVEEMPELSAVEFNVPTEVSEPSELGRIGDETLYGLCVNQTQQLNDELALLNSGDECLKFGLLQEALEHYRCFEMANPGVIEGVSRVIRAALWLEDHETAIEALWRVANIYRDREALDECQDSLGSLLALRPNHKAAREMMVEVFLSAGQEKLALWHLSQMAERWIAVGEYEYAGAALERLSALSGDQSFRERLAKLYDFQGRLEPARALYRDLRRHYEEESCLDKALEASERVVASPGYTLEDVEVLLSLYKRLDMTEKLLAEKRRLAKHLRDNGERVRAVELLKEVMAAGGSDLHTERMLVELYLELGELHLAENYTDSLAERFLQEKAFSKGIELFDFWLRTAPTCIRVAERLAQFYQRSGDLERAKLEWLLVAQSHQNLEDYPRACLAFERAVELAPEEYEWRLQLAVLKAERLQQVSGALDELRNLFAMDPGYAPATNFYLELLLKQRDFDRLLEVITELQTQKSGQAFTEGILRTFLQEAESRPEDLDIRYTLGRVYLNQGATDKAIELFQRLRRHKSHELCAYHHLGLCFAGKSGLNMRELALSQFRKGLALSAQNSNDMIRLRYDTGRLLQEMGRTGEALAEFLRCPNHYLDVADRVARLSPTTSRY